MQSKNSSLLAPLVHSRSDSRTSGRGAGRDQSSWAAPVPLPFQRQATDCRSQNGQLHAKDGYCIVDVRGGPRSSAAWTAKTTSCSVDDPN